ncbi:MAG: c-type cytochrome [Caulobacteraceae bacterium]
MSKAHRPPPDTTAKRRGVPNLAVAASLALLLAACARAPAGPVWPAFGGDPERGATTITQAGCGACHEIPGVPQATGLVGPPLNHFSRRTMIAGLLPNTPANLIRWVRYPQSVVPGNAMPDATLSEAQTRDVAAYLYSLR